MTDVSNFERRSPASKVYTAEAFEYDQTDALGHPVAIPSCVREVFPDDNFYTPLLGDEARKLYSSADIVLSYSSSMSSELVSGTVVLQGDPAPDQTGKYVGYSVSTVRAEFEELFTRGELIITPENRRSNWGREHLIETLEQRLGATGLKIITT